MSTHHNINREIPGEIIRLTTGVLEFDISWVPHGDEPRAPPIEDRIQKVFSDVWKADPGCAGHSCRRHPD